MYLVRKSSSPSVVIMLAKEQKLDANHRRWSGFHWYDTAIWWLSWSWACDSDYAILTRLWTKDHWAESMAGYPTLLVLYGGLGRKKHYYPRSPLHVQNWIGLLLVWELISKLKTSWWLVGWFAPEDHVFGIMQKESKAIVDQGRLGRVFTWSVARLGLTIGNMVSKQWRMSGGKKKKKNLDALKKGYNSFGADSTRIGIRNWEVIDAG